MCGLSQIVVMNSGTTNSQEKVFSILNNHIKFKISLCSSKFDAILWIANILPLKNLLFM